MLPPRATNNLSVGEKKLQIGPNFGPALAQVRGVVRTANQLETKTPICQTAFTLVPRFRVARTIASSLVSPSRSSMSAIAIGDRDRPKPTLRRLSGTAPDRTTPTKQACTSGILRAAC